MKTDVHAILAQYRGAKQSGDEAAACHYLRAAVEIDPDNLRICADLGALLRELERPDEALAIYRRILSQDDRNIASHFGIAWITRARQDERTAALHFRAALEHLRTMIERDSGNTGVQTQTAIALRELGCFDEAAAIHQRILAGDERHSASHEGLGWIARKRGEFAGALTHFRRVAELNPADLAIQLNLAQLLVLMRRAAEARAIYARLAAQMPRQVRVRTALGRLAREWQDWEGALAQFQAASALDPQNQALQLAVGRAFQDLGRWDEAERTFRAILDRSSCDVEATIGLAETAEARGDPAAALELYERAAATAPLDYRPKNGIRRLKVAEGNYDWRSEIGEAIVVARSPDATFSAQVEAARTLVQYGLTEVAAPLLSHLQAHSPEARQLVLALGQIERMGLAQPIARAAAHPDAADNQLESLQGFLEKPVPGSDTLLLVFAGTNNRLWMTLSLLHRILRKTGVSIVYARDLLHDWYAGGVVGLGDDFESTVAGFRRLAAAYGARRILTLGNCVGCLGALRFGLSLGAEGVLGFGPKLQPAEQMEPAHMTSLRALRAKRRASHKNVRAGYLAAAERPAVTLFFGERCAGDAADVRMMAEVPGVIATAIPGSSDPDSLKDLLVLGLLDPVLRDFVANATVAPELRGRVSAT